MESAVLARVFAAWDLSPHLNEREPGTPPEEIDEAQRILGRRLPAVAGELYRAVGAGSLAAGNLTLHPLLAPSDEPESFAVTTASGLLRSWNWPVPDELVVFGDNGAGDYFGLWLPAERDDARSFVVELGGVFDDRCLAVVGDDLASFLAGWTAYYLVSVGDLTDTREAVAALGVPEELRSLDNGGSDDEFYALLRWANPGLPDPRPHPYERGLTAAEVDELARS